MSIIWPNQFNPEPEDDRHYDECDQANEDSDTEVCICYEIRERQEQDHVDQVLQRRKEEI
jgi:hypothetical protein